ncbi:MAG: DUF501 domain-containing protein [Acidimicrobiia bacterium]
MNDQAVIASQIGRPLRARAEVVVRCHLDLPVVTKVPPVLDDGTPFPTLYWLSCPLAVRRVARLESAGAIARIESFVGSNSELASAAAAADERYAATRAAAVPEGASPEPAGGVGGNKGAGIKCLHAHYADSAAGNHNPIGEIVRPFVEPLDCLQQCVREDDGVERNPDWREP